MNPGVDSALLCAMYLPCTVKTGVAAPADSARSMARIFGAETSHRRSIFFRRSAGLRAGLIVSMGSEGVQVPFQKRHLTKMGAPNLRGSVRGANGQGSPSLVNLFTNSACGSRQGDRTVHHPPMAVTTTELEHPDTLAR